ncbi:MAG: tRNA (adenosine(37)-N6)-threonylcarbamoyltransferase complex ATPase subunit type 1 TsaE [Clostridia bacterium]|nr:tRNA (adenosine(37)-N6)-threonylcarbamoyltransferase complex ATPase subunit type 1 TsaE [Clostridia bacterium]
MTGSGRLRFTSGSRGATFEAGRALGRLLRPGDIVALDGDLGAGKTVLAAGIAAGIGCKGAVSSPTFVLAMDHPAGPGGMAMRHMDLYRLTGSRDYLDSGLDEMPDPGVSVVEWASVAGDALPPVRIGVSMQFLDGDRRRIEMVFPPPDGAKRAGTMAGILETSPGILGVQRMGPDEGPEEIHGPAERGDG